MTIQILKRRSMEFEQTQMVGIGGEFRLVVRGQDGAIRRDSGWFKNLILNTGLNRMGSAAAISGCAIGTGSAAPAVTDASLQTVAAYTTTLASASTSVSGSSPYSKSFTRVFRFGIGTLNGNYSEIGVGWLSNAMFSRALIVDAVGAPTTITVGPAEQLDVSYRLTAYHQTADATANVTISGTTHTITTRPAGASSSLFSYAAIGEAAVSAVYYFTNGSLTVYSGALGGYTATPSGTAVNPPSPASPNAYSNNSLQATATVNFPTGGGNVGGISSMSFYPYAFHGMAFQMGFSPAIAKDANKTLSLTFGVSWARRP